VEESPKNVVDDRVARSGRRFGASRTDSEAQACVSPPGGQKQRREVIDVVDVRCGEVVLCGRLERGVRHRATRVSDLFEDPSQARSLVEEG